MKLVLLLCVITNADALKLASRESGEVQYGTWKYAQTAGVLKYTTKFSSFPNRVYLGLNYDGSQSPPIQFVKSQSAADSFVIAKAEPHPSKPGQWWVSTETGTTPVYGDNVFLLSQSSSDYVVGSNSDGQLHTSTACPNKPRSSSVRCSHEELGADMFPVVFYAAPCVKMVDVAPPLGTYDGNSGEYEVFTMVTNNHPSNGYDWKPYNDCIQQCKYSRYTGVSCMTCHPPSQNYPEVIGMCNELDGNPAYHDVCDNSEAQWLTCRDDDGSLRAGGTQGMNPNDDYEWHAWNFMEI